MRCLLELAQMDGIGVGEERNEAFYDNHCDEISQKYCHGRDPVHWCMNKANKIVRRQEYICSWIPNKDNKTYTVFKSEYSRDIYLAEHIKNIKLPKDGVTKAEQILRALYYFNHASKFENVSPYKQQLDYYIKINPGKKLIKNILYFEESRITLYN